LLSLLLFALAVPALADDKGTITGKVTDKKTGHALPFATVRSAIGDDTYATGKFEEARHLFEAVALDNAFVEFLTIRAYDRVE